MNKREELIKELDIKFPSTSEWPHLRSIRMMDVADFIIQDRKRVVEPFVKHKKLWCGNWSEYTASQPISETLKNAGIDTDK